MILFAVKHKPEDQKVFWFDADLYIAPYIRVGSRVTCSTRYGEHPGEVVAILNCNDEETHLATHQPQNHKYEKILSVDAAVSLNWIEIPRLWIGSDPNKDKLRCRELEYYLYGRFDTPVKFKLLDGRIILSDGYTAYLTAKKLGHTTLEGNLRLWDN